MKPRLLIMLICVRHTLYCACVYVWSPYYARLSEVTSHWMMRQSCWKLKFNYFLSN